MDSKYSPRNKRIAKLQETKDKCSKFIKTNRYNDPNDMLKDAVLFLELEKEIQEQQAYLLLEAE